MEEVTRGEASGEAVETAVGVPGARLRVAAVAGRNVFLELIEYVSAAGDRSPPRTNDIGAAHVGFEVDDIEATHARLLAEGITFVSAPSAPLDERGGRIAFLRDPDGILVELIQPGSGGTLADVLAMPAADAA